jgi:uncharacterized protein
MDGPGEVQVRRFADLAPVPWRNGAGVTREVARAAEPDKNGEPRWRVSIADLRTDGPFSLFPGVHRVAVLVDDEAVELTVDGVPTVLARFVPFSFGGDAVTRARLLSGPARLLNVMRTERPAAAVIDVVRGGTVEVSAHDPATHLIVMLDGVGSVVQPPTDATAVGPLDAVLTMGRVASAFDVGGGVAAVVRLL